MSMKRFTESFPDLTEKGFDTYPVWKWVASNDAYCPVWQFDPLPEDEPTLFMKARFETPGGDNLRGYLVGRDCFYAFGLFVEDEEYVININLPETIEAAESAVGAKLGRRINLFPLKYETDLHFAGKQAIKGVLEWP